MNTAMMSRRHSPAWSRSAGFTLIELLVAMGLGLLITLAAASALIVARTGFTTIDAASQLRDNARFATDLIQRLAVQAGFKDVGFVTTPRLNVKGLSQDPPPSVFGFDNAVARTDALDQATPQSAGAVGYGSDVLILRYQPVETFPGSGVVDQSMIDCSGKSPTVAANDRDDTRVSVLYVAVSPSDGEPALMCMRSDTGLPNFSPGQPLVRGVENFQVLYGVDGVKPNTAIDPNDVTSKPDSVPERYLRADQLTVPGNDAATRANWRRVRSLRIGMILRSDPGAVQQPSTATLYPLGLAKSSSGAAAGSAFSSAADVGTIFTPPSDTRLRQVVNFTVHLRNDQGL